MRIPTRAYARTLTRTLAVMNTRVYESVTTRLRLALTLAHACLPEAGSTNTRALCTTITLQLYVRNRHERVTLITYTLGYAATCV